MDDFVKTRVYTPWGYGIQTSIPDRITLPWGTAYVAPRHLERQLTLDIMSFIAPLEGKTISLGPFSVDTQIEVLLERLSRIVNINHTALALIYKGNQLDPGQTLAESRVPPFSTLLLLSDEKAHDVCKQVIKMLAELFEPCHWISAFRPSQRKRKVWDRQVDKTGCSPSRFVSIVERFESCLSVLQKSKEWKSVRPLWMYRLKSSSSLPEVLVWVWFLSSYISSTVSLNEVVRLFQSKGIKLMQSDRKAQIALLQYAMIEFEQNVLTEAFSEGPWRASNGPRQRWKGQVFNFVPDCGMENAEECSILSSLFVECASKLDGNWFKGSLGNQSKEFYNAINESGSLSELASLMLEFRARIKSDALINVKGKVWVSALECVRDHEVLFYEQYCDIEVVDDVYPESLNGLLRALQQGNPKAIDILRRADSNIDIEEMQESLRVFDSILMNSGVYPPHPASQ